MKIEEVKKYYHSYYEYTYESLTIHETIGTPLSSDNETTEFDGRLETFKFLDLNEAKKACIASYKKQRWEEMNRLNNLLDSKRVKFIFFLTYFGFFKEFLENYKKCMNRVDEIKNEISNAKKNLKVEFLPEEINAPIPLEFGTPIYFLTIGKKIEILKYVISNMKVWHTHSKVCSEKFKVVIRYECRPIDKNGNLIKMYNSENIQHHDINFKSGIIKLKCINGYGFFQLKDALIELKKMLKEITNSIKEINENLVDE